MQEDKKELTKEEKIEKAKVLMNEIHKLELTKEELNNISGGFINRSTDMNNSSVVVF